MILSEKKADGEKVIIGTKNFNLISDLKSLFKSSVLIANVIPVFTGLWLALYFTDRSIADQWDIVSLTIVGSTMVMAGALVINNWYDVDIDTVMARTKSRPTVTGTISLKTVLAIGIVLSILGFVLLCFTTAEAAIYAFAGWFTYVVLYTMWSKRRYTFNTIIGSISGAVTPLIGWGAVDSAMNIIPIILFLILFIWQMPHTYSIAMKKCNEYKMAEVAMMPVVSGFNTTKRQMVLYISCLFPLPFFLEELGTVFMIIAAFLNIIWLGLSVKSLLSNDDLKWAHIHFLYSVNYIAILFFMMVLVTIF